MMRHGRHGYMSIKSTVRMYGCLQTLASFCGSASSPSPAEEGVVSEPTTTTPLSSVGVLSSGMVTAMKCKCARIKWTGHHIEDANYLTFHCPVSGLKEY